MTVIFHPSLEQWAEEYGLKGGALSITVEALHPPELPWDVHGQTWPRTSADNQRYALIQVQACIPVDSITFEALLWHEFCHAEPWINLGTRDGHGPEWKKRLHRKRFLAFWDRWINPFTYMWYSHVNTKSSSLSR